jgi:glycosyltransferase involved in cell wall biosynthesis
MDKIIFVNATAATEGGALTILKQFLGGIATYSNKNIYYCIFCSLDELGSYESKNIKIVNNIKGKKWLDRIKWDLFGLKKWSKKKDIKADLIISFQNTGVRYYKDIKQLIYLHQSIPFAEDINWDFFNKNERILWFYKNIYKKIIKYSMKDNYYILVQTEWMRNAVIKQFNWDSSKIFVIKPDLVKISIEEISNLEFKDRKFHIFYPANKVIYKNHELIIRALRYIKDRKKKTYDNLMIHFTIDDNLGNDRNDTIINLIRDLKVNDHIKLEGKLSYETVLSFYKSCNLMLFPSYIETFGLPLIEAASFGIPILAADMDYAREVMVDYEGVKFLDYKDAKLWAKNIILLYNNRVRYKPYYFNYETSWKDFFKLIDKLIVL